MRRLGAAERGDLAVLEQDVVERQRQLAVGRRPVLGIGRDDDDVAVQAQLLAVVLADVRVVPVDARIWELHPIGEALAHLHRRLRFVGAVVAVLDPHAVPVHGRLQVTLVHHIDDDLRPLPHSQRRAGDRTVVGEHPHSRIAEPLRHRSDPQLEHIAVGYLDELGIDARRKTRSLGRERVGGRPGRHEVTGAGIGGTVSEAVAVGGSLPPMSSRNGGYVSVISAA